MFLRNSELADYLPNVLLEVNADARIGPSNIARAIPAGTLSNI